MVKEPNFFIAKGHSRILAQIYPDFHLLSVQIFKDEKLDNYVDGKVKEQENWIRYVNCSRWEEEQILIGIQYFGAIHYRSYKPIKTGDDLLVFFRNLIV